jgi:hypothetical protein
MHLPKPASMSMSRRSQVRPLEPRKSLPLLLRRVRLAHGHQVHRQHYANDARRRPGHPRALVSGGARRLHRYLVRLHARATPRGVNKPR